MTKFQELVLELQKEVATKAIVGVYAPDAVKDVPRSKRLIELFEELRRGDAIGRHS